MCTFHEETKVQVCDVAIGHVKSELASGLDAPVRYTHMEGEGTMVEAVGEGVDAARFQELVRNGMAAAEA
ncbi:MAG TPA: hypothetical protein VHJ78_05000 [Actinomycetota bacterium]|nr:hypothetical protein [Actinomycetota bacterium]